MRKLLGVCLILLITAGLANSQHYYYPMGNKTTVDTLVAATEDTTGIFNFYYNDVSRRPGDPCFEVYTTWIGTNTTHDSLAVELWVTDRPNLAKDGNGWMFVKEYYSYSSGEKDGDGLLASGDDFIIVADTLNYISCRYGRLILNFIGGDAADSSTYLVYFVGDRGTTQ